VRGGRSPLACAYAGGIDLVLPTPAAVSADQAAAASAPPGGAAAGSGSAAAPSGSGAATTAERAAAAAAVAAAAKGSGGGGLLGLSSLSTVSEYLSAMNAHKVYWTSPDSMAYMLQQVVLREREVAADRLARG